MSRLPRLAPGAGLNQVKEYLNLLAAAIDAGGLQNLQSVTDTGITGQGLTSTFPASPGSTNPLPGTSGTPNTPTGLQLSYGIDNYHQTHDGYIVISWTPNPVVDNIARYDIFWRKGSDANLHQLTVGGDVNLARINSVIPGLSYTFAIQAHDTAGRASQFSLEQSITLSLDVDPPAVPTGLTATAIANGVLLTWTEIGSEGISNDLKQYSLAVSTDGGVTFPTTYTLGPGNTHFFIPGFGAFATGVAPTFTFKIAATDWTGNTSAYSATTSVTVNVATTLSGELEITNGDSAGTAPGPENIAQIELGWVGSRPVPGYQQWISTQHTAGSKYGNLIEFWTSDGTGGGVFPTNAVLGLSIENGRIGVNTAVIGNVGEGQQVAELEIAGSAVQPALLMTNTSTTAGQAMGYIAAASRGLSNADKRIGQINFTKRDNVTTSGTGDIDFYSWNAGTATLQLQLGPGPSTYFWDDFESAGTGTLEMGNSKPGSMGNFIVAWHSLGNEAGTDNSIAYWDQKVGNAWTFASHIASPPGLVNDEILIGGHADWSQAVGIQVQARVATVRVGSGIGLCINGSNGDGYYFIVDSTTTASIYKRVSGVYTNLQTTTVPAMTLGNPIWLNFQKLGAHLGGLVGTDSSGAPGTWTQSGGGIQDNTYSVGRVALHSNHSNGDSTYGGAFVNVFVVKIPTPIASNGLPWSTFISRGEPAFAWSDQQFNSGTRSLSVFNATSNGQGGWTISSVGNQAIFSTWSAAIRLNTGASGITNAGVSDGNGVYVNSSGTVAADSTWHNYLNTFATNNPGLIDCLLFGGGTIYFDTISIQSGNEFFQGLTVAGKLYSIGGITSQGPISIAPGLNSTPAPSSFGSLPIKFAEVVTDANANNVVTIDHIPQWGRKLVIEVLNGRSDVNALNTFLNLRFNGDEGTNYDSQYVYFAGAAANSDTQVEALAATAFSCGYICGATATSLVFNWNQVEIPNYTDTTHHKLAHGRLSFFNGTSSGNYGHGLNYCLWAPPTTQAINRIDVILSAGNWVAGSTIIVYIYP